MKHRKYFSALRLALLVSLSACAKAKSPAPNASGRTCSTKTIERLYFGFETPTGAVKEAEWQDFLARIVTPFFPEGLTVIEGKGQWLGERKEIVHEPSRIIEIVHDGSAEMRTRAELVAEAYKTRFHQDAVMTVRSPAEVCF